MVKSTRQVLLNELAKSSAHRNLDLSDLENFFLDMTKIGVVTVMFSAKFIYDVPSSKVGVGHIGILWNLVLYANICRMVGARFL